MNESSSTERKNFHPKLCMFTAPRAGRCSHKLRLQKRLHNTATENFPGRPKEGTFGFSAWWREGGVVPLLLRPWYPIAGTAPNRDVETGLSTCLPLRLAGYCLELCCCVRLCQPGDQRKSPPSHSQTRTTLDNIQR